MLKLARAIKPRASDGTPQQVFYDMGVGSYYDSNIGGRNRTRPQQKHYGTTTAISYKTIHPVMNFTFLASAVGAYTVRSLCGLINNCGILKTPPMANLFNKPSTTIKNPERPMRQKAKLRKLFERNSVTLPVQLSLLVSGTQSVQWAFRSHF